VLLKVSNDKIEMKECNIKNENLPSIN